MKNENIISRITAYRQVLDTETSVGSLSQNCYISIMQLRRDFYSSTGYSVNEYLRRLRLSNALCKIKNSAMPLDDIAYSCGYSSQQALCREIRILLNTTATEYRNSNDYYQLSAPRENIPFLTEVKSTSIPQTQCLKYYSSVIHGIENKAVTAFLRNNPDYSGRIFGRNGAQKGNLICYELYIEPYENINITGFEKGSRFNGYAVVCAQIKVKNNEENINSAWDYLYSEWLPNSMFEYAGIADNTYENHYFEEYYYKDAAPTHLKLYLPLVRSKNNTKITIEASKTIRFLVSSKIGANAEKEASDAVISYLAEHYPHALRNIKEFYSCQDSDIYTCGVKTDLCVNISGNMRILNYERKPFAIMHLSGICDFAEASYMLLNWLVENNIPADGKPFAVYDTSVSYDDPTMKIFCPIIVKNVLI